LIKIKRRRKANPTKAEARETRSFAILLGAYVKMGGAGDQPAPVADPPTGTERCGLVKNPSLLGE